MLAASDDLIGHLTDAPLANILVLAMNPRHVGGEAGATV